jgi:YD repeat-containing protein
MKKWIFLLSLNFFQSHAGVNLRNGNYYISYKDMVATSKGIDLELVRTYNSKSTETGWFGYGWGTPFETKLEASADGSVIIFENGNGGKARFTPSSKINKSKVSSVSEAIIKKIKAKSELSGTAEKELRDKLMNNSFYRHKLARVHAIETGLKSGTVLTSHDFGYQTLYVVDKGYKRVFSSGLLQLFDKKGQLIATSQKNGYKLKLSRNKQTGKVEKILDSVGNQFFLAWNSDGKISKIKGKSGSVAEYKYNDGNLIESTDINGNQYQFTYDKYHNLTLVKDMKEKDKKLASIKIEYAPKTFFTTKVNKRGGEEIEYVYEYLSKETDLHYRTIVIKNGLNGDKYANSYEYEHQRREDGSVWLKKTKFITGADYKSKKVVGGLVEEQVNNECCEQPVKITRGSRITEFAYNNDGLLTAKKSNDGTFTKLEYDSKYKKVKKVSNKEGTINYSYNKKGELAQAKSSNGKAVLLVYDIGGKVSKMVEQVGKQKNILSFKYNGQGKPSEIEMNNKGKLIVSYDSTGEVKKVDTKGDRAIASQVSTAFQNLMNIVEPAGVDLSL